MNKASDELGKSSADLNLQVLQIEIQRMDIFIQKAVRLWQLAGQDLSDKFRGLYVTAKEASELAVRPFGHNWGSGITLNAKDEKALVQHQKKLMGDSQRLRELAAEQEIRLRLFDLATGFGLSQFEYDAFLICLAPALDLRYERLYAFLQDDVTRKIPSANLILDLLLPDSSERLQALDYFRDQATLIKFGLLYTIKSEDISRQNILRQEFGVPTEVLSWLMGNYRPANELADYFRIVGSDQVTTEAFSFDQTILEDIPALIEQRPLFSFHGSDVQRMKAAAYHIASTLNRPLLEIDLNGCKTAGILDRNVLRIAMRDAVLTQAIPFFSGWDCWVGEEGSIPGYILGEVDVYLGPVIVGSESQWRSTSTSSTRPIIRWDFDLPNSAQRFELWHHYLGSNGSISAGSLELLAGQFSLTSAQIRDAVWTAKNIAFQEVRPIRAEDLFDAARQHSAHHLDSLAVKLPPRYDWNDIVLPDDELDVLKEITSTVRERPRVLEGWGLGRKLVSSAGISALFAGPPGTGKTLAAQVISAELGMHLYKIDLSTVVSKYIGETEKNLERIFTQAHNSNTILFFDEADAIFGKRSEVKDAHDRYANIEVGYLLQRMESYDGVVILATNLRANLDEAFTRRLQFVVNFPFPDMAERLNIWKVLIPPDLPIEATIDLETFANRFELSGGSIRNVIVTAAYQAANESRKVSTKHLLHGVRREMQKMGRLIDEKSLEIS